MRLSSSVKVFCVIQSLLPSVSSAQVVRGNVREASGSPVAGAVATLYTDSGTLVHTSLTTESGTFFLRAPTAGAYYVETKRIGARPSRTGVFVLAVGDERKEDIVMRRLPILQSEVRVTGRTRCERRPTGEGLAATLWDNARAALAAVTLSQSEAIPGLRVTRFDRDVDAASQRVLRESRTESFASGDHPFVSADPAFLATRGFVQRVGNGFTYYAPDASTILSDPFLQRHCFRAVRGEGSDSGLVGLRFEPTAEASVADVSGVLWLDAKSTELRSLAFVFENAPPPHERGQSGGSAHFRRLPSGVWYVDRWLLRWPRFAGMSRRGPGETPAVFGNRQASAVLAYREEGAEVTIVSSGEAGVGRVSGSVIDPDGVRPPTGATVVAERRGFVQSTASTDDEGRFILDVLPGGQYTLSVRHPLLDSLGIRAEGVQLQVRARDSLTITLSLPKQASIWNTLCPSEDNQADHAVLRVILAAAMHDETDEVSVRVSWSGDGAGGMTKEADDDSGATFCSVPAGRPVKVSTMRRQKELRSITLTPRLGTIEVVSIGSSPR